MPRLAKITSPKVALNAKWFKDVVNRIEEIKPVAGANISIIPSDDGQAITLNARKYVLNVCIDGAPAQLTLFGL